MIIFSERSKIKKDVKSKIKKDVRSKIKKDERRDYNF